MEKTLESFRPCAACAKCCRSQLVVCLPKFHKHISIYCCFKSYWQVTATTSGFVNLILSATAWVSQF